MVSKTTRACSKTDLQSPIYGRHGAVHGACTDQQAVSEHVYQYENPNIWCMCSEILWAPATRSCCIDVDAQSGRSPLLHTRNCSGDRQHVAYASARSSCGLTFPARFVRYGTLAGMSFFSGAGFIDLGLEKTGFEVTFSIEKSPHFY